MSLKSLFQQLNKSERRRIILVTILTFSLTTAWVLFSPQGALQYYHLKKKIKTANNENQELREKNLQLRQEIEKLKNNSDYLEEVARKKLGLIKKNEIVFTFK